MLTSNQDRPNKNTYSFICMSLIKVLSSPHTHTHTTHTHTTQHNTTHTHTHTHTQYIV